MTRAANLPCNCGSGKPFKKCCREVAKAWQKFRKDVENGNVPAFARIRSENGEESSMQISDASVTVNGVTKKLNFDDLTLRTNSVEGDRFQTSEVCLSQSFRDEEATTHVSGNAELRTEKIVRNIEIAKGEKELKVRSPSGGFMVARIGFQHNKNLPYFDFMFGRKGKKEVVNDAGRKNRSHVGSGPDGNSQYIRVEGKRATPRVTQRILPDGTMIPTRVEFICDDFDETAYANFSYDSGKIVLVEIGFVDTV